MLHRYIIHYMSAGGRYGSDYKTEVISAHTAADALTMWLFNHQNTSNNILIDRPARIEAVLEEVKNDVR